MDEVLVKFQEYMVNIMKLKNKNELITYRSLMYKTIKMDLKKHFSNMEPYEDGLILWKYLNSLDLKVNILSAPIFKKYNYKDTLSEQGKKIWIDKYLEPKPNEIIFVPANEKCNYAKGNILIDDKAETINQWNEKGGFGILHISGNSQLTISKLNKYII